MEALDRRDVLKAFDAKIVLFPNTVNEVTVRGINKLKPPGYSRSVIDIMEFGKDFDTQEAAGGSYSSLTGGGNLLVDDRTGQDIIRKYMQSNTRWTDNIRFYLNGQHFVAAALDRDLGAGFECTSFELGEADKNGIYSVDFEFVVTGAFAIYSAHITASTIAIVENDPAADTITDSGNGFITAGFANDMSLIIEGSAADDGAYHCETAAAGVLTLNTHNDVTGEAAGSAITIHGGLV